MNDTKKQLKKFTITMASGTLFGGQYRDEAHAREVNELFGKVVKVEQRDLFSPEENEWMDREKAWHRCH